MSPFGHIDNPIHIYERHTRAAHTQTEGTFVKIKNLATIVAVSALAVAGIATAANATGTPGYGHVEMSPNCQGSVELSIVAYNDVPDSDPISFVVTDNVAGAVVDFGLNDIEYGIRTSGIAMEDGEAYNYTATGPGGYTETFTGIFDCGYIPPTNGTVTSVAELTCDMVSTPVPEGSARVVYTDIDGVSNELVVGGLIAGVNSGVLDDGSENGLPLDIPISACQEPTTPPVIDPPVGNPPPVIDPPMCKDTTPPGELCTGNPVIPPTVTPTVTTVTPAPQAPAAPVVTTPRTSIPAGSTGVGE